MDEVQIKLSALWVALMLTYLLGDVLRIFSGDFKPGEIGGMQVSQGMYLGMAALFVIPIAMVFLSLTLNQPVNRWANIIVPILFFVFNLIGLPTYPSAYDKFLIIIVFIIGALMLYSVLYKSKLIPRWISVWGLIAAVALLTGAMLSVFTNISPTIVLLVISPIAVQEMVMAGWLIVKGFNPSAIDSGSGRIDMNETMSPSTA